MADVKALLKEARKLIDDKNFTEAQECCKNILRKDKQNYLGLLLLGKSLQDSDQAALAFQKAVSVKPDNPLGWFGLASFYEKKEDKNSKLKLLDVYDEILKLQLDDDKKLEFIIKVGELGCSLKSDKAISILIGFISRELNENKTKIAAEKQLLQILKTGIVCTEDEILPLIEILDKIHDNFNDTEIELICAKIILQQKDLISALEQITNLKYFVHNKAIKELLCQDICTKLCTQEDSGNFNVEHYYEKITEGIENYKYAKTLKSLQLLSKLSYLEAYNICLSIVNFEEPDNPECIIFVKCTAAMKKWDLTQKLTALFLNKSKNILYQKLYKKYLFISLAKQEFWETANNIFQGVSLETLNDNILSLLAECYIRVGVNAECILSRLEKTNHYVPLKALQYLQASKYNETVMMLEERMENDALCYYYLGVAYWQIKEYNKSHINLLKAAKLDTEQPNVFLYLGNYYYNIVQDLYKAKKCYEKAHNLNKSNNITIKYLSEVYSKLDLFDLNYELLLFAERNNTFEEWIAFRLGIHYLRIREWEKSIICFRNVIKKNHKNATAFECLADAYYLRGSYTSALKAYNKVISLNPSHTIYCQTRIAATYGLLTQYDDAIKAFKDVLSIDPKSILALKGLAETWKKIAKKKSEAQLYGNARECAQHAVDYVTKALLVHRSYSCLWKMLGDILIFITKLPDKYSYVFIKSNKYNDGVSELIKKEKLEIYPQAISSYSYSSKQRQQLISYDLASAYLSYFLLSRNVENCRVAFNLTVACIKNKPKLWRNWNLLGKICFSIKKYNISQHCFIKALQSTKKISVTKIWCNLGTLYLKLKLHKLSNYCFWRGQSTLPSYPQSWIGQGLIAEVIREEEAMDLFRHATRLGYHHESTMGYADWVCRTLKNNKINENAELKYVIEGLHAIPYAMDLMEWFLTYNPSNACAATVLGILQERSGLLKAALRSYENALLNVSESKKNIALLNMGRILLRTQDYENAIKIYKSITEASLDSACGLALSLFKKGLYEESYSAYDTALHWLSNEDSEKSDILVAMAGIVYMFKGPDDAKTLLFHSIQMSQKKPTPFSLFAICSLGLLHSDQSLYKLALSELQKYEKDVNFCFDVGFLKTYLFLSDNDLEPAIKTISELVHDHPNSVLLWFYMSQCCLRSTKTRAKVASSCAQRALYSTGRTCDIEPSQMIATASIAEHIAGEKAKALVIAKSGLHMYPHKSEIWAALMLSVLVNDNNTDSTKWLIAVSSHVRRHLDVSRTLSKWISQLEKKLRTSV